MARRRNGTLTDPRVLKALAHPARQELLTLLDSGEVVTASSVAEHLGLTPSAVSHHLRQLEKYGLARRAPAGPDGRARPWRSVVRRVTLIPEPGDPVGERAVGQIIGHQLELLAARIESSQRWAEPGTGPYTGLGRTDLWLTQAELRELQDDIHAALQRAHGRANRTSKRHPKDAAYHVFVYSLLRDDPPTGG